MSSVSNVCRLCHSQLYKRLDEETQDGQHYTIVQCVDCSLVYIRETCASISPEYVSLNENDLDDERIWCQSKHKEPAFRQCMTIVRSLDPRISPKKSGRNLLDVGCGTGGWLGFVQPDYECYGFDASPVQSRSAQKRYSNVRCASSFSDYLGQFDGVLPKFDLVTMWDVLEHIRQPVEFLNEIAQCLSPNGLLFASVPAALPMIVKSRLVTFGWPRSRFSWNPQEHVVYYSHKTLPALCAKAGLEVLRIGSVALYPRRLSAFEVVRRIYSNVTGHSPSIATQLYVLAKHSHEAQV